MNRQKQFEIALSDLIVLFSQQEEDGYIASGSTDEQLIVKTTKDKECVFKVMPMTQYKHGDDSNVLNTPELSTQLEGKNIIYGQIIQLQHRRTGRYIASDTSDVLSGAVSHKLFLDKVGSQRCWFKIMPYNRKEGEKVMVSDKIMLIHYSTGYVVHLSDVLLINGQHEVDLRFYHDADKTGLTPFVIMHSDVGGGHRALLESTVPIRLFNEVAGYLHGRPEEPVKAKIYNKTQNDIVSSYKTIWEIIGEEINTDASGIVDKEIHSNTRIQIRLYGTRYYLTQKSTEKNGLNTPSRSGTPRLDNLSSIFNLSKREFDPIELTKDSNDPNTFFNLVPIKRDSEEIPIGTHVWIRSDRKKYWITCSDDFAYTTVKGSTQSEVEAVREFNHQKAAFMIKLVPRYQIDEFEYVALRLPKLEDYLRICSSVDPKMKKSYQDTLSDLIRFCSISDVNEALQREGTPHRAHQNLLGNSETLKLIVNIINIGYHQDLKIQQLAYHLLKHIVRNNPKIGNRLYEILSLPVIHNYSDDELNEVIKIKKEIPIAATWKEMYIGNSDLIYGVKRRFIFQVLSIIKVTSDPQYFRLLSSLCTYKDTVISHNQNLIMDGIKRFPEILILIKEHSGVVKVEIRGDTVSIEDFNTPNYLKKNPDDLKFLINLINLFSNLCLGRNTLSIKTITEFGISTNLLFLCIRNENLLPDLRAAFSDLFFNMFIDTYPNNPNINRFRKVWFLPTVEDTILKGAKLIAMQGTVIETTEEIPTFPSINYLLGTKNPVREFKENPRFITEFLQQYSFNSRNFRFDNIQKDTRQPEFLIEVMKLMRYSMYIGNFKRGEPIALMDRLKEILEIKHDEDHLGEIRQLSEHEHQQLIQIKIESIHIINRYLDIITIAIFGEFMQYFGRTYGEMSDADLAKILMKEEIERCSQKGDQGGKKEGSLLYFTTKAKCLAEFVPVILFQIRHLDPTLTSMALKLLKRVMYIQNRWATLLKAVYGMQLLTSDDEKFIYGEITKFSLNEILLNPIDPSTYKIIVNFLDKLAAGCHIANSSNESDQKRQLLLRNLNVHIEIINLVKRPLLFENTINEKEKSLLISTCYNFLRAFVKNNLKNQKLLHEHIEYFSHQMIYYGKIDILVSRDIASCITEIYLNNEQLCSSISEKHIAPFITMIITYGRDPVFLEFFHVIIKPFPTQIIKANQNLVLKLLLSDHNLNEYLPESTYNPRRSTTTTTKPKKVYKPLMSDQRERGGAVSKATTLLPPPVKKDGFFIVKKLDIPQAQHEETTVVKKRRDNASRLVQPIHTQNLSGTLFTPRGSANVSSTLSPMEDTRIGLVSIFALCAEGKNYFTEITCQKLIPLEECLNICSINLDKPFYVTEAYAYFAVEVFLNTESANLGMPYDLQVNKKVWTILEYFYQAIKAVINGHVERKNKEFDRYIFTVVLPFIQHFYSKFFSLPRAIELAIVPSTPTSINQNIASEEIKPLIPRIETPLQALTREVSKKIKIITPSENSSSVSDSSSESSTDNSKIEEKNIDPISKIEDTPKDKGHDDKGKEKIIELPPNDEKHKVSKKREPSQIDFSNDLLSLLMNLREYVKKNPEKNISTLNAMRAIFTSGIEGTEDMQPKINKLMKSDLSKVTMSNYKQFIQKPKKKEWRVKIKNYFKDMNMRIYQSIVNDLILIDSGQNISEKDTESLEDDTLVPMKLINTKVYDQIDYLELFIEQLTYKDQDPKTTLTLLKLIMEYIKLPEDDKKKRMSLTERLERLSELEAPNHVVALLSNSKTYDTALECLELMITNREGDKVLGTASIVTAVLLRTFTSQGNIQFFQDIIKPLQYAKHQIKEHKQMSILRGKLQLLGDTNTTVSFDMGIQNYDYESLELILKPRVRISLRVLELLASDRKSSIFKTLLVHPDMDVVKEVALFIKAFESSISKSNIDVAIQAFKTLKEFCKSNPTNQKSVASAQIFNPANRILMNEFKKEEDLGDDPEFIEWVLLLKLSIIEFLLALVEDDPSDPDMPYLIISQINPKAFEGNTRTLSDTSKLVLANQDVDTSVHLASKSFRLIKFLVDSDTTKNVGYLQSLEECEKHCQFRIGKIEVVYKTGSLETIYFPIPQDFRNLEVQTGIIDTLKFWEKKTKKDIFLEREQELYRNLEAQLVSDDINWERSGDKIDSFMAWSEKELLAREQARASEKNKLFSIFGKLGVFYLGISFIIAIVINILILGLENQADKGWNVNQEIKYLGIIQVIISAAILAAFFIERGRYINARKWLSKMDKRKCYMLQPWTLIKKQELPKHYFNSNWLYYVISIYNIVSHRRTILYLLYFIVSIVGISYSHYFFSFHLLQILGRSTHLKFIVKALAITAIPLLLIAALMFLFIYIFSLISWAAFQEYYQPTNSAYCETLAQCILTNIFYGIPSNGGLFEYLSPFQIDPWINGITPYGVAWIFFQLCFFLCFGTIFLNLVFATIVDAFGQLRQKRKEAKQSLGTVCFICSLERDAFQQKAKDFSTHLEKEHNVLHYYYFFAYLKDLERLREKSLVKSDLSALEEELSEQIFARKFLKFFPIGRAIALESEEEEDKYTENLLSQVERLERTIEQTSNQQEKIFKQTNDTTRHIQQLIEQFNGLNNDIMYLQQKYNEKKYI